MPREQSKNVFTKGKQTEPKGDNLKLAKISKDMRVPSDLLGNSVRHCEQPRVSREVGKGIKKGKRKVKEFVNDYSWANCIHTGLYRHALPKSVTISWTYHQLR